MADRLILATVLLLGSSLASPLAELAKRGGESLHLVNCNNGVSQMYYYSNDGNHPPSDYATVSNGPPVKWEGYSIHGYFSDTGVTFTSNILSDAQTFGDYSYAGTGNNGKPWVCYKDDRHAISGTKCNSIYYCFPQQ